MMCEKYRKLSKLRKLVKWFLSSLESLYDSFNGLIHQKSSVKASSLLEKLVNAHATQALGGFFE